VIAVGLHDAAAAVYLAASVLATLGLTVRAPALTRAAVVVLALGALVHGVAFLQFSDFQIPPPHTGLPGAVSLVAWMGTVFFLGYLALNRRSRLTTLIVLVAPAAFVGVFFASLARVSGAPVPSDGPAWAHAHVLLASAGIALLGVAGGAGLLFVVHHRALKAKRAGSVGIPLPPLEALDRVGAFAVATGFLLLTLSLVTGVLWVHEVDGMFWPGTLHANTTLVAWLIYAALVVGRFVSHRGARTCATSAVVGFAFLSVAVLGVGLLP